jgi:hypothetical protein
MCLVVLTVVDVHAWHDVCWLHVPDVVVGGGVVVVGVGVVVALHWFELQSQFEQLPVAGFNQLPPLHTPVSAHQPHPVAWVHVEQERN